MFTGEQLIIVLHITFIACFYLFPVINKLYIFCRINHFVFFQVQILH